MKVVLVTNYATVKLDSIHCAVQEDFTGADDILVKVAIAAGKTQKTAVPDAKYKISAGSTQDLGGHVVLIFESTTTPPGVTSPEGVPFPIPPAQRLKIEIIEQDLADPDDNLGHVLLTVAQLTEAYAKGGKFIAKFSNFGTDYQVHATVTNVGTTSKEVLVPPEFATTAGAKIVKTPADVKAAFGDLYSKVTFAVGRTVINEGFNFERSPWAFFHGPQAEGNRKRLVDELQFIWSRAFTSKYLSLVGHARFQPWTCVGAALALLFHRAPMRVLNTIRDVVAHGEFRVQNGALLEVDVSFFSATVPTAGEFNQLLPGPGCDDYAEYGVHRPQGWLSASSALVSLDFDFDLAQWMLMGLLLGGAKSWCLNAFEPQSTNYWPNGAVLDADELADLCTRLHGAYIQTVEYDPATPGWAQWGEVTSKFHKFGSGNVLLGLQAAYFVGAQPSMCGVSTYSSTPWSIPPVVGPVYHVLGATLKTKNATTTESTACNFLGEIWNRTTPEGKVRQDVIVGLVHSMVKVSPVDWEVTWQIHGDLVKFHISKEIVDSGGMCFAVFVGPDGSLP